MPARSYLMREAHLTLAKSSSRPSARKTGSRTQGASRHRRLVDVWLQLLDERPALGEGLPQPPQVVGLAVVVLRERAEAENDALADYWAT